MSRLSWAQASLFESCVAASATTIVVESEGQELCPELADGSGEKS
jgi:hypothetical protein